MDPSRSLVITKKSSKNNVCTWIIVGICVSSLLVTPVKAKSNVYVSGCRDQELELSCPVYHRIAVRRIFYGVKIDQQCRNLTDEYTHKFSRGLPIPASFLQERNKCCRASHTDCRVNDRTHDSAVNSMCSGQGRCRVNVKVVRTKDCYDARYTDYMTIIYDCVHEDDVANFCSNANKKGHVLYLSHKEYPAHLRPPLGGEDCQCLVQAHDSKGITIQAIDVFLSWGKGDRGRQSQCRRSLVIEDSVAYAKKWQCKPYGIYGYRTLYSRLAPNLTVTLSSQDGIGMAYVWLQVKASKGEVGIICGRSLQIYLDEMREKERRQREEEERRRKKEEEEEKKKNEGKELPGTKDGGEPEVEGSGSNEYNNSTAVIPAFVHNKDGLNSDMATIIGGIVGVGFILIVIAIIAIALHCRRIHREKREAKPLELYPATTNSEPLDLSSYCKYDYDAEDDHSNHLCTISRSSMKMVSMLDSGGGSSNDNDSKYQHHNHNGFVTVSTADDFQSHLDSQPQPSPPLPAGISTPPPSTQNQPLLSNRSYRDVHYPGNLSLRFVKPIINNGHETIHPDYSSDTDHPPTIDVHQHHHQQQQHHHGYNHSNPYAQNGHTTLPAKAVLIHSGPKSPLGKRSKSVTFSQPVAMVTPLNSESEESMEPPPPRTPPTPVKCFEDDIFEEEPNYDNLHQMDVPDEPLMSGKRELHMVAIPRWMDMEGREESPPRPLSTFQSSPSPQDQIKIVFPPPPPHDYNHVSMTYDPGLTPDSDDTAYMSDKDSTSTSSSFWSPNKKSGKPVIMPKPQKGQLYETGV